MVIEHNANTMILRIDTKTEGGVTTIARGLLLSGIGNKPFK